MTAEIIGYKKEICQDCQKTEELNIIDKKDGAKTEKLCRTCTHKKYPKLLKKSNKKRSYDET
jgi:hypothetical protein